VLAALVQEIAVPQLAEVRDGSERLAAAVASFAAAPGPETLRGARDAWRTALLAWKRAQAFRHGPLVESNALVRATYWPARPAAIEWALGATGAIDDAFVRELAVDARGLYALEHLLFHAATLALAHGEPFDATSSRRRLELADALARNVARYGRSAAASLGDGEAFAARFAEGEEETLSALVGEMIAAVESATVPRLDSLAGAERAPMLRARGTRPGKLEGELGGVSHEVLLAQVTGVEQLYRGGASGGVGALAYLRAPELESRVRRRFAEALAALTALRAPLERLAQTDPTALAVASGATKALERALKVELAGALGVTFPLPDA
jgi:predicted lipoprotein